DVVEIEAKLDKLVKLCSGVIEAGRAYISANKLFINGIRDLSHHCKKEEMISECLEKCGESLQEIVNYHMILFDQAQRSVKQQLHNFVKEDVRKFKETKKQFDKVREDMEIAQVKNAQAPRNKPHEVEEASSTLITTRKCFRHLALDYVFSGSQYSAVEKREMEHKHATIQQRVRTSSLPSLFSISFLLSSPFDLLSFLSTFSLSSHKLLILQRLDRTASPSTSSIDSASEPRERIVKGESILQRVQSLPGNEICCDCGQADPRWASINLGILLCIECSGIHRSLGVHCSKVRSLTLDTWEPELMKLMCELGNTVINQIYEGACEEQGLKKPGPNSSRQEKEAWIKAKYVERKFLKKMCGAEALVEGSRKSHHWSVKKCRRHNSSIRAPKTRRKYRHDARIMSPANLSAGTSAKFRRESLFCPDELDSLFSYFDTGSGPRSLSSDSGLGGSTDGSTDILVFGSVVDSVTEEEREDSDESSGEVDIEQEASDPEDGRELDPKTLLHKASRARNLSVMAEALAHGADVNSVSEEDESKSPLIQAVAGGSLIACEFLLQNGADVNQRDVRGRAPLHHATCLGHTGQVCLFLKRGASQMEVDEDGQDPLSIAVQAANPDIVTLLRLARMNEEMREADGPFGQPGQYPSSSPTEQQYRKCIQEFICLSIDEC
uniref:Arf-GAP with coiled-coil, ANK repeat and PH domain-containing protein n=1 Tax=Sinocyclocheilus grahami TaxID=75366 RepID=A0A672SPV3_SINGR